MLKKKKGELLAFILFVVRILKTLLRRGRFPESKLIEL
jgi:hypothetical protein